ncbi:MAG: TIGR02597 family protein [Verrucomicrobiota bacterium]|nr:TIGR02597 family protein [Verrucomicrobiota bacterium]
MRYPIHQFITVLSLAFLVGHLSAETNSASTPPQGYQKIILKGAGDSYVSLPLLKDAVARARVTAVESNSVTVAEAPFTLGAFDPAAGSTAYPFRVEFITGQLKGVSFKVAGNSENRIIVDGEGYSLTAHPSGNVLVGDLVVVRPAWQLGEVFGDGTQNNVFSSFTELPDEDFFATADSLELLRGPLNLGTVVRLENQGWRNVSSPPIDASGILLDRLDVIKVRRIADTDHSLVLLGNAPQTSTVLQYAAVTNSPETDVLVSWTGADVVSLEESGLQGVISPSQSIFNRGDEVLLFSDNQNGFDSGPERTFIYQQGGGWKELGNTATNQTGSIVLAPSKAFIIRRKYQSTSSRLIWTQP